MMIFMNDPGTPTENMADILHLREQASAALDGCRQVGKAIRLYERYLELKRDYRVKMVGRFLVIEGGLAEHHADIVA